MIFLNPSILLGLLAASIPIIIHILNFRKLQKVEFSTLAFLKELQKSKIKKIKIKQWLLLLLRTLIIIFLVLAFARPTLDNVNLVGASSSAKTSSAFIIDNSFSMSYIGDDGSTFNNSKMFAKNIVYKMEDGDEFIFLQSLDSVLTTTNKESAIKIIEKLDVNLKLENTIRKITKAKTILEKTLNLNKEIFLFSDFQSSTFTEIGDSLKHESSDNNITLYSFDMTLEKASNYAISNLKLENTIIETNKPLIFSATIHKYSADTTSNFIASLFLNDKRVAQQSISFAENAQQTVKFETTLNTTGLVEARVEIEEDNILYDNVCYYNFLIPKNIDVLIVYDNPIDITFLEAAIKSYSESEQIVVNKVSGNKLTAKQLDKYKTIFLVSTKLNSQINLNNYIIEGGNLIFIPPSLISKNEIANIKSQLNFLNGAEIITTSIEDNSYLEFGNIDFQHPIFHDLFENKTKNKIESPNIYKYLRYNSISSTTPIIKLLDDKVFLGEYKNGNGTIVYFNSAFALDWSNFPIKGIFAPIISRIVFYLSSSNKKSNSYFIGDEIPINVSNVTYPIIDVSLPVGDEKINLDLFEKDNYLFNSTSNPGNYKFYNNNTLLSFANVNIDTKESDLTKISDKSMTNEFEKLFGEKYFLFDKDEDYIEKIKQARYGTELWKFLLIIALILALLEMFVARNTKRDLAKIN